MGGYGGRLPRFRKPQKLGKVAVRHHIKDLSVELVMKMGKQARMKLRQGTERPRPHLLKTLKDITI